MPSGDWYITSPDRLSFFAVHWAKGSRLTIPYAAVQYVATSPPDKFEILAAGIKIEGRLGSRRSRVQNEMSQVTDALTRGEPYDRPQSNPASQQEAPLLTGSGQAAPEDPPAQNLESFQEAFQTAQLRGVFHVPDAQVRLQVLRMSENGWIAFQI